MASGGLKISIKLKGGAKEIFKELGVNLEKAVDIAMTDTADTMANDANLVLADSIGVGSGLFNSIKVKDKPFRKEITTNIDYASYVEFGTGPQRINKKGNKVGGKQYWPPALPDKYSSKHSKNAGYLEQWRKLKTKFKTHDEIRYAIYKNGTRPQRFMGKALGKNRGTFPRLLTRELRRQSKGKIVKR